VSPFLLPAGAAVFLFLLFKKNAGSGAATETVDPNPEPAPEPGPQVEPQPATGTPLPPLVAGGTFPAGTVTRTVSTPSGAFIHSAPNALVSTRIGRIANGSRVAVFEAGPPSPDDQGGPNNWVKISTAGGMSGFIAESLLGPPTTAGAPVPATPGVAAPATITFVDPLGNPHEIPTGKIVVVDPITGILNAVAEPGKLIDAAFSGLSAGAWANPRSAAARRRPAYGQTHFAPPLRRGMR
jgi:hypothetical protein